MMKSWADHCSSDEESLDDVGDMEEQLQNQTFDEKEEPAPQPEEVEAEAPAEEEAEEATKEQAPPQQEQEKPKERVYDFPDKPPFTAFVGNLSFNIKDPEELKAAIAEVAMARLNVQINVIGGRIATDRRDGKPRGFGYIEVETLDEVRTLLVSLCVIDEVL